MLFLRSILRELGKDRNGLTIIIIGLIILLLSLIIWNYHTDNYFNDLSDKANYILHYTSLIKTGFASIQEIRLPIFLSYFLSYLSLGLGTKNINIAIIMLVFLNIIIFTIFYRAFQNNKTKEAIEKPINKYLIMGSIIFFFNFAILNIFRGLYAELLFFPLIFLGLYFLLKKKYGLTALIFLICMLTKIEGVIIFPLYIAYYLIYIFNNLPYQKRTIVMQILLWLIGLSTLFLKWELGYLKIYYNLPPGLFFFIIASIISLLAFVFLYNFRNNIIKLFNRKRIKYFLIFLIVFFFLINPLRYIILGGTLNESFILNNLATATDLDLINVYRIVIVFGPLFFIALFWWLKRTLYSKQQNLDNPQNMFVYVLFMVFFIIFFNESYHEPNLMVWVRRFFSIIMPILSIMLVSFLMIQQKRIQLYVVFFTIIYGISYNGTLEYAGYTEGIRTINSIVSNECNNITYLYDKNMYTHEAIYTSLALYEKETILKYSNFSSGSINHKIPTGYCIIIPERFIGIEGDILIGKTLIAKIPIKFNKYDQSILEIPKKVNVSYNIYIYK